MEKKQNNNNVPLEKHPSTHNVELEEGEWESLISALRLVAREEHVLSFLEEIANKIELQVSSR